MSRDWWTAIYFPRAESCAEPFLRTILDSFLNQGCSFMNPRQNNKVGSFGSLDGMEILDTADLSVALHYIQERRGGVIQLWDPAEDMEFLMTFDPCGELYRYIYPDRDFPYGTVHFAVDYSYLHSEAPHTIQSHYQLILRWSQILAQTVRPLYGWGDIFDYDVMWAVDPNALSKRSIPRLSWWNYFSHDYVNAVGVDVLSTSAAWTSYRDQHGMTIILSAPGEPPRASGSDLALLGVDSE